MSEFLIFRLYAPLVSWGDTAVGGTRPSADHPTRSAILGLAAGALGLRREDEEAQRELDEALGLAIHAWSNGQLLRDYHTIETPHQRKDEFYQTRGDELRATDTGVVLSQRDYRCDALFDIGLWQTTDAPRFTLSDIRVALRQPVFIPYMGRKSCPPALPMNPTLIEADDCLSAFRKARGDDEATFRFDSDMENAVNEASGRTNRRALYWEGAADQPIQAMQTISRRDRPLNRKRWQFTSREEHFALLDEELGQEE